MNKTVALIILAVGAIVLLKKSPLTPTGTPTAPGQTNQVKPAQPSQQFPVTAVQDPRVDNASQPWYTGILMPSAPVGQTPGIVDTGSAAVSEIWQSLDQLNGTSAGQSLNAPGVLS